MNAQYGRPLLWSWKKLLVSLPLILADRSPAGCMFKGPVIIYGQGGGSTDFLPGIFSATHSSRGKIFSRPTGPGFAGLARPVG